MLKHLEFNLTRLAIATSAVLMTALSGCYVVPMDPRTGQPVPSQSIPNVQQAPSPVTSPVRLYPANDAAARYGLVNATVTNDLHGKGVFNAAINGEAFVGEATRKAGSSREGIANGTGNRGSYLSCEYTLNNPAQGTGKCRLSDGAVFNMHIGN